MTGFNRQNKCRHADRTGRKSRDKTDKQVAGFNRQNKCRQAYRIRQRDRTRQTNKYLWDTFPVRVQMVDETMVATAHHIEHALSP